MLLSQIHLLTPGGSLWVEPGFDVIGTPYDPAFPERNVPATRYHDIATELGPAVLMEYARWGNYFEAPGRFNLTDWVVERDRLLLLLNYRNNRRAHSRCQTD